MQAAFNCRLPVDAFPPSVEPVPLIRVTDDMIFDGTVHLDSAVKNPLFFTSCCHQFYLGINSDDVLLSFPVDEEGEERASCLERQLYRHDRRPGRSPEKVGENTVRSFYHLVGENPYYPVVLQEREHHFDAAVAVDDPVAVLQTNLFQYPVEIVLLHGAGNNGDGRDPCPECQSHQLPVAAMGSNADETATFFTRALDMFESSELDARQQLFVLAKVETAEFGNEDADVDEHLSDYGFRRGRQFSPCGIFFQ